jgi:hypothetical protein
MICRRDASIPRNVSSAPWALSTSVIALALTILSGVAMAVLGERLLDQREALRTLMGAVA